MLARRKWVGEQLSIDPDRAVFVDETWAKTNMTRTYGRSSRGARLVAGEVVHHHDVARLE